jgi:glycosyltransferase involved in cell wall biosynthesis
VLSVRTRSNGPDDACFTPSENLSLSVIIPVRDSEPALRLCLAALEKSSIQPSEIIVVDDASRDDSARAAEELGGHVIRLPAQLGPARARNAGAQAARGDVLVFIDADVCVHPDALALITADLANDPTLSAVFGSYDSSPAATDFISHYKTLQHHFFHQTSPSKVCTFWSGCGAVRRDIFLAFGGFSADYTRPSIEDIEFGTRVTRAGYTIKVNPQIQVKHLKKWTLGLVIRTDILDRATPWTRLLLQYRNFPSVLNLVVSQRISVLLALSFAMSFVFGCLVLGSSFVGPFLYLTLLVLGTFWVDSFIYARAVVRILFLLVLFSLAGLTAYLTHTTLVLALIAIEYMMLAIRRLVPWQRQSYRRLTGIACGLYAAAISVLIVVSYTPIHWISFAMITAAAGLLYLNKEFYFLLARLWGRLYAISAIPFHLLYQLCCAAGLVAGTISYLGRSMNTGWHSRYRKDAPRRMTVFNVEISTPNSALLPDDEGSAAALVICRLNGRVVGQFESAIENGRMSEQALRIHLPRVAWNSWKTVNAPERPSVPGLRVSVIVCTRDRTQDLARCLSTLRPLLADGHEIVVVDSCPSTDGTARLVSQYAGVRYVLEPRPGAGIARNRGLVAASCEIVAFTDDDAEVDPAWLDGLLRNFDDPTVALVTGLTLPLELETEAQIWFERTNGFQRGFERREFDLTNLDPLAAGVLGASVNMALRKVVLAETGMLDEALGPGTGCRSGEDHEFFYRLLSRGHRAVYDPAAVVWHRHRREWKALRNALYGYGVGVFAWWTRALLVEREFGVLRIGPGYFWHHHVKNLIRALFRRPGSMPFDLAYAEFTGALAGPWAYCNGRRRLAREGYPEPQAADAVETTKRSVRVRHAAFSQQQIARTSATTE